MLTAKKKIDVLRVLKLRLHHHLSLDEIAKQVGCSKPTVHYLLNQFKGMIDNPEILDAYSGNRAKLLTAVEWELLQDLMDTEKRQKASLNNVAYAFQQIYNARRLEEGKSTGNLNIVEIEASLAEIREKEKRLEAELASLRPGEV